MRDLEELNLLNQLIDLGAKAAHAHAQSNSDDGHKGTAAYVHWQELRAEMGELIRSACAPQADKAQEDALSQAARDVLAERQRQIKKEGWTRAHDDEHADGSLAAAAACYAIVSVPSRRQEVPVSLWPKSWAPSWWKPSNPRRNLVKAAALILAELERIDRAAKEGN